MGIRKFEKPRRGGGTQVPAQFEADGKVFNFNICVHVNCGHGATIHVDPPPQGSDAGPGPDPFLPSPFRRAKNTQSNDPIGFSLRLNDWVPHEQHAKLQDDFKLEQKAMSALMYYIDDTAAGHFHGFAVGRLSGAKSKATVVTQTSPERSDAAPISTLPAWPVKFDGDPMWDSTNKTTGAAILALRLDESTVQPSTTYIVVLPARANGENYFSDYADQGAVERYTPDPNSGKMLIKVPNINRSSDYYVFAVESSIDPEDLAARPETVTRVHVVPQSTIPG